MNEVPGFVLADLSAGTQLYAPGSPSPSERDISRNVCALIKQLVTVDRISAPRKEIRISGFLIPYDPTSKMTHSIKPIRECNY